MSNMHVTFSISKTTDSRTVHCTKFHLAMPGDRMLDEFNCHRPVGDLSVILWARDWRRLKRISMAR